MAGLIVNEVGNVSLERGVTSLSQSAELGGCFTSLVSLSPLFNSLLFFPADFVPSATHINCIPSKISAREMTHLRDRLSLWLVTAGHFSTVSLASSTSVGVDVPRKHIVPNDKQLVGFYEK